MRRVMALALLACVCAVGCNKKVAGTWIKDTSTESQSPIAAVSFCEDGTFTAHAEYGGNTTRVVTGHYNVTGDVLHLDTEGTHREYGVTVDAGVMTLTHEGHTSSMVQLQPR